MDAVKILGGLLNQRGGRVPVGPAGGSILNQVLGGLAAQATQGQVAAFPDPRFGPAHHAQLESLVRSSIVRHQHAGGQLAPPYGQWANQHGHAYGSIVPGAPLPRPVGDAHQHCSGLGVDRRAEILLQAMIIATQADGQIDAAEQDNILRQLQPLDAGEVEYLRREFSRPHDLRAFVQSIPPGMEYEVYQVSLMAIHLDSHAEVRYLRDLATCMRIDPHVCNQIHARVGASPIF